MVAVSIAREFFLKKVHLACLSGVGFGQALSQPENVQVIYIVSTRTAFTSIAWEDLPALRTQSAVLRSCTDEVKHSSQNIPVGNRAQLTQFVELGQRILVLGNVR